MRAYYVKLLTMAGQSWADIPDACRLTNAEALRRVVVEVVAEVTRVRDIAKIGVTRL